MKSELKYISEQPATGCDKVLPVRGGFEWGDKTRVGIAKSR
jgi:hypothetical protein